MPHKSVHLTVTVDPVIVGEPSWTLEVLNPVQNVDEGMPCNFTGRITFYDGWTTPITLTMLAGDGSVVDWTIATNPVGEGDFPFTINAASLPVGVNGFILDAFDGVAKGVRSRA